MPSTKPAKGTQDLMPAKSRRRQMLIDTITRAYEAHGFEPLATPSIERLDALLGKYGDEGDQLIFRIMKRGANLARALKKEDVSQATLGDLGLRYDLTVPLARVVAEHQNELPRIFKRYQIQQVWRADRPAKGRFREFTQCDVDIVGCDSMAADAEVLSAAATALRGLGFTDIVFHTNHRDLLYGLIEVAGIDPALESTTLVAVDKLDKIGWDGVIRELNERGLSAAQIDALRELFGFKGDSNAATLAHFAEALASSERGARGVAALQELMALVASGPAEGFVQIDPSLARGLSYYTGPIFEVKSPQLAGSIAAGGRYDGLVGAFLGRNLPAVGFSLGLERLEFVLDALDMAPTPKALVDVCVLAFDKVADASRLAAELRGQGLRVDLFTHKARLGKQFQYAEQRGIRHVVFAGPDELERGEAALKDLVTGQQQTLPRAAIAEAIEAALSEPLDQSAP